MFRSIEPRRASRPVIVTLVPGSAKEGTQPKRGGAAHDPGFRGELGEAVHVGPTEVLLGLGDPAKLDAPAFRTLGARLIRFLDRRAPKAIRIDAAQAKLPRTRRAACGQALGEGLAIANWRFDDLDGTATKRTAPHGSLAVECTDADLQAGLVHGLAVALGVNYARRLAATPPNICNPDFVASEARRFARASGLRCKVIGNAEAQRRGMGALVAVGRGSKHKPCLVHLSHVPRRPSRTGRGQRIVLVGKAITYDTGGYSLKVNNGMRGMKYDKSGGMAVLGTMLSISALRLPVEVHAVLAVAENMVSDDAYRPDDIVRASNGVSIEVTNTDAEGRLVLADALAYACSELEPTAIVDIATLTGGVGVALGAFCAGFFCNDDDLRARYERAAESAGEKAWRLPLWPEHRDYMRSQHADILNSNANRGAHPIQGAAFLSFFVDERVPWCHMDIASMANSESGTDLCCPGPTGYGVRTLVALAEAAAGR